MSLRKGCLRMMTIEKEMMFYCLLSPLFIKGAFCPNVTLKKQLSDQYGLRNSDLHLQKIDHCRLMSSLVK